MKNAQSLGEEASFTLKSPVDVNHSLIGVNMDTTGTASQHWLDLFILPITRVSVRGTRLLCSPMVYGLETSIFFPPSLANPSPLAPGTRGPPSLAK